MASKKEKIDSKLFWYKTHLEKTCVHDERVNEPYGLWRREYENKFLGIEPVNGNHPDVVSTVNLLEKDGYLVWVEYSTGDSLGLAYCGGTEIIAVVSSFSSAQELKSALESWRPKNPNTGREKNDFAHKTEDGQTIKFGFVPWCGYFERLESVHVERVKI